MIISSFFTDSGIPKTGLSPAIKIIDLSDNSVVISGAAMSEVGEGIYKYDFSSYSSATDYFILSDGGELLSGSERYSYAGNENGYLETQVDSVPASVISGVMNEIIEGDLTFKDSLKVFLSVLAGKSSGGNTNTITFRNIQDTGDTITATVDVNGNRTAVTIQV